MCMYLQCSLTANGSRRLEVSQTCLSYEGRPDGLTASDARLEFETAQRYFDLFLFTLTSLNATSKNCGRSDNVNCLCGCHGMEVIMKKCSDHEIFITKIYIHVIFSIFTKILNHKNLELYGIDCIHTHILTPLFTHFSLRSWTILLAYWSMGTWLALTLSIFRRQRQAVCFTPRVASLNKITTKMIIIRIANLINAHL